MTKLIWTLSLLSLFIVGCSAPAPAPTEQAATSATIPPTVAPTEETTGVASSPAESSAATQSDAEMESATHPAERLLASFTQSSQVQGELLVLVGQVLDGNGDPVPDVVVEIWQTDASGVYDHPGDPSTESRDTGFQFYGSTTADEEGWYAFRTIMPGRYEPRPRHIHFKVKQGDDTLLTSQFYFSDDVAEVQDEGMFQAAGESGDLLLLQLVQGDGSLVANGQIVVDTGTDGSALPLTPSQGEGPYYPVNRVADHDNDLVTLP